MSELPDESDLCYLSGAEIRRLLLDRKISATELTNTFLKRIDRLNPVLQAFQTVTATQAQAAARLVDRMIAEGLTEAPMLGIPVCIPDTLEMRDTACARGSVLFADNYSQEDNLLVARLRDAGAIILGKTRIAELAIGPVTEGPLGGPVRNPWDVDLHAGGPSGGTSAAVAAGLATIGMDTEQYGSLRQSAGFCGIFGLKAGRNRIPGVVSYCRSISEVALLQRGAVCRHVEDAARLFNVVAQPDVRDPLGMAENPMDYEKNLMELSSNLKIHYSYDMGFVRCNPLVRSLMEDSLVQFEAIGARVEPSKIRLNSDVLVHAKNLLSVDRYTMIVTQKDLRPDFVRCLGEVTREWLRHGNAVTGVQVSLGFSYIGWLRRYLLTQLQQCDVLVTPLCPILDLPIDGLPVTVGGESFDSEMGPSAFTAMVNFAGFPAMSLPCGYTDNGNPFGLQVIAKRNQEKLLLQLAQAWSQRFPWVRRRPDDAVILSRSPWM